MRELLLELLRRRFGTLPGEALAHVEAADAATLMRWAERTLTATTLDGALER